MRNIRWILIALCIALPSHAEQEVKFDAVGHWVFATGDSPDYWEEKAFWVDVLVKNLAYEKTVGIRWTDDNWATQQDTSLRFEQSYSNGYERWGLDFAPMGKLSSYYIGSWMNYITNRQRSGGTQVTIEFAIFYEVNGNTYWDNNGGQNYSVTLSL